MCGTYRPQEPETVWVGLRGDVKTARFSYYPWYALISKSPSYLCQNPASQHVAIPKHTDIADSGYRTRDL